MLGSARLFLGSLQAAAVVLLLSLLAQALMPKDMDRGALGRLTADSTRYLDPETTGSIARLLNKR